MEYLNYFTTWTNWSGEWTNQWWMSKPTNKNSITKQSSSSTVKTKRLTTKYVKEKIPKALREQVWINKMGKNFHGICSITWCSNDMTCFNFDCGHNIPESKGGKTDIENLIPICRNCNTGMGNKYTIDQWKLKYKIPTKWYFLYLK